MKSSVKYPLFPQSEHGESIAFGFSSALTQSKSHILHGHFVCANL